MKVLFITGEDYAYASFCQEYDGTDVTNVIQHLESFQSLDEEWELKVLDFGEIDPKFADFVRKRVMDYDHGKHTNFLLESETIIK